MITLGDYIGQLLSEVSRARAIADRQSVEIAHMYAKDPLLQTLPVPRVRLPEVRIKVPVLIADPQDVAREGKGLTSAQIADQASDFINRYLGGRISTGDLQEIRTFVGRIAEDYLAREPFDQLSDLISREVKGRLLQIVGSGKSRVGEEEINRLTTELYRELRQCFSPEVEVSRGTWIISESHRVKEQTDGNNLTQIELRIVENSLEWQVMQGDDGKVERSLLEE